MQTKFGVDHTINYNTHPNWAAEVQRITNGNGADHVVETAGVGTMQQSMESVAYGGVVSVVGFLTDVAADKMPNVTMLALMKTVIVRGILGGSKEQLQKAVRFVGSRELPMPMDKTFGFNRKEIIAALGYVAAGKHMGKVCISLE